MEEMDYNVPDADPIEEARLSKAIYEEYASTQSAWEKQAVEDRDFYNGSQWSKENIARLKRQKQFPIVVNVIKPAVEQAKALLTTNRPRFNSTGREDSDTKTGKIFSDILTYIWDISYGNPQLKKCVEDYYVEGRGIGIAYYDPNADFGKGEVYWGSIDPKNVYPDPNSKDIYWRDAAHILIADVLTEEQATGIYGNKLDFSGMQQFDGTLHQGSQRYSFTDQVNIDEFNDQYHKKYLRIDRYTKIKDTKVFAVDTNGKEHILNLEQFNKWVNEPVAVVYAQSGSNYLYSEKAARMLEMLQEFGTNIFHYMQDPQTGQPTPMPGPEQGQPGEIPQSTTQVEQVIIANLIESGVIPINMVETTKVKRVITLGGLLIWQGIMDIQEYPFFILSNHWNRNPYPMSDVRFVRPLQEYVNKLRSLMIAHASNTVNVKWWLPRGSVDKKKLEEGLNTAGTFIGEYDAELGTPVMAGSAPLPNELYKHEADARADIQEALGIYPLMQGDAGQAPQTFKGTVALDEYGQRRIKSKKDDIENALNHFCKVMVQMVQAFYTETKTIRIIQPDATVKETKINLYDDMSPYVPGRINDVTVGQYDVVVVSGSMLPSNRWAQFEYYAQMFQMGLIDQVEVLKKTEVVDTEGVLERFSEMNAMKQQIMQLQQQLEAITGDKQTTDRENLHLKQKVEVEKFKTDLNTAGNKAQMASQIFTARMNDELKNVRQSNKQNERQKK